MCMQWLREMEQSLNERNTLLADKITKNKLDEKIEGKTSARKPRAGPRKKATTEKPPPTEAPSRKRKTRIPAEETPVEAERPSTVKRTKSIDRKKEANAASSRKTATKGRTKGGPAEEPEAESPSKVPAESKETKANSRRKKDSVEATSKAKETTSRRGAKATTAKEKTGATLKASTTNQSKPEDEMSEPAAPTKAKKARNSSKKNTQEETEKDTGVQKTSDTTDVMVTLASPVTADESPILAETTKAEATGSRRSTRARKIPIKVAENVDFVADKPVEQRKTTRRRAAKAALQLEPPPVESRAKGTTTRSRGTKNTATQ